ncbi:MAG: AMP-binding protein, partial [Planctomycetota bacterium]
MSITNVKTLIEMLELRADETPDTTAFTFIDRTCPYSELWRRLNQFGAYLQTLGTKSGDRVVLTLPNSPEFFFAFYGIQRVGAIAVPIFPGFGPAHILSIVKLCGANTIVVPSSTPEKQLAQFRAQATHHDLSVITVSESASYPSPTKTEFPQISPDDVAFIQYTSGSTGNPKGVQLDHHHLITNVKQMIAGMEITEDDIFVSWLPVYHDMGLILKTMVPFYLAAQVILLPTNLKNVSTWLEAIQRYKATFTAAPDFAYRLCVRHIENPADYDLSTLRVVDFEETFGLKNVMVAGYGLAEATVGVSMWPPQTEIKVDERGYVSIGSPFPEIEVQIIDKGQAVGPGQVGEIAIKSPANSRGYFGNPEATRHLFWQAGYILSGDLGYLDQAGHLFIVGRIKNTIIHAGRTIYPQEI